MRNLLLTIQYDGAAYHGWQLQNNAVTIQGKLQDAIKTVFQEKINVYGCSRTDAGVHAKMFCCNFRAKKNIEVSKVVKALNANLPFDIVVKSCQEASSDFHARYDCKGKEYLYIISNSSVRDPFLKNRAMHYHFPLDADLMNSQAKDFIGKHDFEAFCASGSKIVDTVREIWDFSVQRDGELVIFKVSGNGFLYNMVRIMVGTLLYINNGKIEKDTIKDVILSKNRENAGITALPDGLYLNQVFY